jgi:hypothetical protein
MKRFLKTSALLLALILLLTGTALAADDTKPSAEGENGATVTLNGDTLSVSYPNSAITSGGQYMVWVLAPQTDGSYTPTNSTILYMDQATANDNGYLSFEKVYPSAIQNSAVFISGTGLNGLVKVGEIQTTSYALGDADGSGKIDSFDVVIVARVIASKSVTKNYTVAAADVNQDGKVNGQDLGLLAQYVAGNKTAFETASN